MQELPSSTRFAVYSDRQQELWQCASWEGVQSQLAPGQSDIFTIVPLAIVGELHMAPLGLTNMLNTGGAISRWDVADTHSNGSVQFSFKVCSSLPQSATTTALHSELFCAS